MAPWLRFLEAWMVQQLLRTPAFHRAVEKVARQVHRVRHGIPPEESVTKMHQPGQSGFMRHFMEELKTQVSSAERQEANGAMRTPGVKDNSVNARRAEGPEPGEQNSEAAWEHIRRSAKKAEEGRPRARSAVEEEHADAAWKSTQQQARQQSKRGFMGVYLDALRDQMGNGKSGR